MRRWKHGSLDEVASCLWRRCWDVRQRTIERGARNSTSSIRSCGGACAASWWRSKKKIAAEPELEQNLKSVLEVRTAGDPDEEQMRVDGVLADPDCRAGAEMGTPVSPHGRAYWLAEEGLALHKIEKDVAGGQSPDREAQFQCTSPN